MQGRDVHRVRPGDDEPHPLRFRSGHPLQSRKSFPHSSAVRRPAGNLPSASGGALRPGRSPVIAIGGVVPKVVYVPETIDEASSRIAESNRNGETLAFVGGGTDLGIG